MDKRSENKRSSYTALDTVLTTNESKWSVIPAIGVIISKFRSKLQRIGQLAALCLAGTKGQTEAKQIAREVMTETALGIAGAVHALASEANNVELMARVHFTPSQLDYARDTDVQTMCEGIHQAAQENLEPLTGYGVDAESLASFAGVMKLYGELVGKPRATQTAITAALTQMDSEFAAADRVLENELDQMMNSFRRTDPEFFNAYQHARDVVHNAATHSGDVKPSADAPANNLSTSKS
jgi:hypothetical protein